MLLAYIYWHCCYLALSFRIYIRIPPRNITHLTIHRSLPVFALVFLNCCSLLIFETNVRPSTNPTRPNALYATNLQALRAFRRGFKGYVLAPSSPTPRICPCALYVGATAARRPITHLPLARSPGTTYKGVEAPTRCKTTYHCSN